jgi:pyruvate carboxylase
VRGDAEVVIAGVLAYGLLITVVGIGWSITMDKEAEQENRKNRLKRLRQEWLQGALTSIHDDLVTQDRTFRAVLKTRRQEQEDLWNFKLAQAQELKRKSVLECWGGDIHQEEDMIITERRESRLLPRIFYIDIAALLDRALRGLGFRGLL